MKVQIGGARGSVGDPEATLKRAREWTEEKGDEILLADARVVLGKDHLESAVRHAVRSQATGTMAARSVSMEALRYLSAQRQVADAIRIAGIRVGTLEMAIAVFGRSSLDDFLDSFGWSRNDSVLDPEGKSYQTLGITETEWMTLPPNQRADLALEKVALLETEK
jgi:KEOPS complex subunit Cgi121